MQFWPRVKAKRMHARVRNWAPKRNGILGFAGYKVGMTHIMIIDNKPTSPTKGEQIFCPVTIVECPPLKVASVRFYKNSLYGSKAFSQVLAETLDKEIARCIVMPKKKGKSIEEFKEFDDLSLLVYTQPKYSGVGKKSPEIFEISVGGKKEDVLKYAKEKLGKEISIEEVFQEGELVDIHAVTKGKGFQGPVKRFGIAIRSHKSEKSRRNPGTLGGWRGQGHVMYRVAHSGRMGQHQRTEYNKQILKIGKDASEVAQKGGFIRYGVLKNTYVLVRGSLAGTKKRLIKFSHSIRPDKLIPKEAPTISYISKEPKQ